MKELKEEPAERRGGGPASKATRRDAQDLGQVERQPHGAAGRSCKGVEWKGQRGMVLMLQSGLGQFPRERAQGRQGTGGESSL